MSYEIPQSDHTDPNIKSYQETDLGEFGTCTSCGGKLNMYRKPDGSFIIACTQTATHNYLLPLLDDEGEWIGVNKEPNPYVKACAFGVGLALTILLISVLLRLALQPWIA